MFRLAVLCLVAAETLQQPQQQPQDSWKPYNPFPGAAAALRGRREAERKFKMNHRNAQKFGEHVKALHEEVFPRGRHHPKTTNLRRHVRTATETPARKAGMSFPKP